jgi:hypothetical protein
MRKIPTCIELVLFVLIMLSFTRRSLSYRFTTIPSIVSQKARKFSVNVVANQNEYLFVPFEEKEEAKSLGARWDMEKKVWYVPLGDDTKHFQKWTKVYLNVPKAEKDEAKQLGAFWDKDVQKWFVRGSTDLSKFSKWLDSSAGVQSEAAVPKTNVPKAPANPPFGKPLKLDTNYPPSSSNRKNEVRVYLKVPFAERAEAKALGAFWDKELQKWYVNDTVDASLFYKWADLSVSATDKPSADTSSTISEEADPVIEKPKPKPVATTTTATMTVETAAPTTGKIILNVPFAEKDAAKELGAMWDKASHKWFIYNHPNPSAFSKWMESKPAAAVPTMTTTTSAAHQNQQQQEGETAVVTKIYLKVPFAEKDQARELGAMWDKEVGKWFVRSNHANVDAFSKWKDGTATATATPKSSSTGTATTKTKKSEPAVNSMETEVLAEKTISEKSEKPKVKAADKKMKDSSGTTLETTITTAATPVSASIVAPTTESISSTTATAADDEVASNFTTFTIVDIDTSGLPETTKGKYEKFTALSGYNSARIVRLSYAICDLQSTQPISKKGTIIKSDGFPIPNPEFHGVTYEKSLQEGTDFPLVAKEFISQIVNSSKFLVFHNAEFCMNILRSELYRYGLFAELEQLQKIKPICIMERMRQDSGLLDVNGKPKAPRLKELISKELQEELPDLHTADMDVDYIQRLLEKWNEKEVFQISKQE